jgi:hypothetical protein
LNPSADNYILSDHYLISGWARGEPYGGVCRWYASSDWDIPDEVSDFQDTSYYAITDKIDNELSTLVGPFGPDQEINAEIIGDEPLSPYPIREDEDDTDLYGTYLQINMNTEESLD